MSLADYYDQLAEIAIGWLGWTEKDALAADVNAILCGYQGRIEMFCAVGWLSKVDELPRATIKPTGRPVTAALFDALFPSK